MGAREQILEALDGGVIPSLMLAERLGYDPVLLAVNDSQGWIDGPHWNALTDLVRDGIVRMRVVGDMSTEYGLASDLSEKESGSNSPIIVKVGEFLNAVCDGLEGVTRPFWNVAQCNGVALAYDGSAVDLSIWDYLTDSGYETPLARWDWPVDGLEEGIRDAFVAAVRSREGATP